MFLLLISILIPWQAGNMLYVIKSCSIYSDLLLEQNRPILVNIHLHVKRMCVLLCRGEYWLVSTDRMALLP